MTQVPVEQALRSAIDHYQAGRFQQSETICRQILDLQPKNPKALNLLAVIDAHAGRRGQAIDLARQAIAAAPGHPRYHYNLAVLLQEQGQLDEAITTYQRVLELAPQAAEVHNNLGNAWKAKGNLDHAIRCYQRALELNGEYAGAHNNLGAAWRETGQVDKAIASFQRAIALQPRFVEVHTNLGNAWREKGETDRAVACHQRALALDPNCAEAHTNLGIALREQGKVDEAIACYQRALALKPDLAEAYTDLGIAFASKGQVDRTIACCRQALGVNPRSCHAHNSLGNALKDIGQLDEAIACYRTALELNPRFVAAHDNLLYALLLHPHSDRRSLFAEFQRWNRQHALPLKGFIESSATGFRRSHASDGNPDQRLRIGYISPDFRNHPVGRFMLPLLDRHDHAAFEVCCYAQVSAPDELTARCQSLVDIWRPIVGLSDEQVADMIRQDRIDILVDLAGHTAKNRLLVLARKPAPVQATYLAYAGGTAVDSIDYRLTDRYLDPDDGEDQYYLEKSLRLAGTYWCYQQSPVTEPVHELPVLAAGKITVGCLNNFSKVSPAALETWARLLSDLRDARLVLHTIPGSHRDRIFRFMSERGVAPERLELVGRVTPEEYFRMYRRIDIALDPFPYAGGTTTCDALWMGVPVVTLVGRTAVGRAGVSILSNVGLGELIARTPEEYLRVAIDLAGDVPRLAELRSTLRQRMEESPLMDRTSYARSIEAAYRTMWRTWCELVER